jgi:hypothetical protein
MRVPFPDRLAVHGHCGSAALECEAPLHGEVGSSQDLAAQLAGTVGVAFEQLKILGIKLCGIGGGWQIDQDCVLRHLVLPGQALPYFYPPCASSTRERGCPAGIAHIMGIFSRYCT